MNEEYIKYLCCPKCKVGLQKSGGNLICVGCKVKYDVINDVPVLIADRSLSRHLQNQIKYFDKETAGRKEYKLEEWQKSYLRRLDENFTLRKNNILVDIGTGSSYIAVEMAKRGLQVIACDLTLNSLVKLLPVIKKHNLSNNLLLVCCNAENLPIRSGIADYLAANAILEHLQRENGAIREIDRVCNDNAGLMITVPILYRYLNPFFIPINYIHDKRIGHLRRYDERILSKKFRNWNLIKKYYTGHSKKMIKIILKSIFSWLDEKKIEAEDTEYEGIKMWATNMISFFKKKSG